MERERERSFICACYVHYCNTWISVLCISLTHREAGTVKPHPGEHERRTSYCFPIACFSAEAPSHCRNSLWEVESHFFLQGETSENKKPNARKRLPLCRHSSFTLRFNKSTVKGRILTIKMQLVRHFFSPPDQCLWAEQSRSCSHRSSSLYLKTGLH